jgi:hypothetical protein
MPQNNLLQELMAERKANLSSGGLMLPQLGKSSGSKSSRPKSISNQVKSSKSTSVDFSWMNFQKLILSLQVEKTQKGKKKKIGCHGCHSDVTKWLCHSCHKIWPRPQFVPNHIFFRRTVQLGCDQLKVNSSQLELIKWLNTMAQLTSVEFLKAMIYEHSPIVLVGKFVHEVLQEFYAGPLHHMSRVTNV